jgi:hypothetical protein
MFHSIVKNGHFAIGPCDEFLVVNDICNENPKSFIGQVALTLVANHNKF